MLYLEDYLEMIEHLPQHFRDTLTQMRELDLQVHNDIDSWKVRITKLFNNANQMAPETRDVQFEQMKQDYYKSLEAGEEKLTTANHLYDLVDKYLRKLEQELHKFKIELEADNAGITEILEKRSLEVDNPMASGNHTRGDKRKFGLAVQNDQKLNLLSSDNFFAQDNYNSSLANYVGNKQGQNHIPLSAQSNDNQTCFTFFNSKLTADKGSLNSKIKCNLTGNNAIAAAASQAIVATQQMQLGRRTASLKASYEAINSGFSNFNLNSIRLDDSDPNTPNILLKSEYMDSDKSINNNKKSRINKKSRTSQYTFEGDNNLEVINEIINPATEPRYCTCHNVSYGEMIYCENGQCPYGQWFHYECVGINKPPKGSWYCASCIKDLKEKKEKKKKEKLFQ